MAFTSSYTDGLIQQSEYYYGIPSMSPGLSGSFSGSFQGDGSSLTGVGGDAFPFTGDAQITGSLLISGSNPKIEFDSNIIIGTNAIATSSADISIGTNAITAWANATYKNDMRVAIGWYASASEGGSIAIGDHARGGLDGVAIGRDAGATTMGQYAVAIGKGSQATTSAVAVGRNAIADGSNTTAIGDGADASATDTVAIGRSAAASGNRSVAIGRNTGVSGQMSVGIGYNADVTNFGIAIGGGMSNSGQYSIILGSVAYGQARANSDAGAFVTYLNNESTPSLKFQINSGSWWDGGGNFGFGTKTPGSTLAVSGSFTTTGSAIMSSSNSDIALSVQGSGSTVFNIIGSEGTLFAIEDDLDGTLFTVNDRSGIPMFEVSSSGLVEIDNGSLIANTYETGSIANGSPSSPLQMTLPSGSSKQLYGVGGYFRASWDDGDSDFVWFQDDNIRLSYDLSGVDIEGTIIKDPASGEIHISLDKDGTRSALDKQVSDGIFDLNATMGTDTTDIYIFAAPTDPTWPYYRIELTRTSATHGSGFYAIVEKFI